VKISVALIAFLLLAGCDQIQLKSKDASAAGRWAIAPATSTSNEPFQYAWRIDTQTGATEMCLFTISWSEKDSFDNMQLGSPRCSPQAVAD
jgi:hypothetical protein